MPRTHRRVRRQWVITALGCGIAYLAVALTVVTIETLAQRANGCGRITELDPLGFSRLVTLPSSFFVPPTGRGGCGDLVEASLLVAGAGVFQGLALAGTIAFYVWVAYRDAPRAA
jgi:hypothetical protein